MWFNVQSSIYWSSEEFFFHRILRTLYLLLKIVRFLLPFGTVLFELFEIVVEMLEITDVDVCKSDDVVVESI